MKRLILILTLLTGIVKGQIVGGYLTGTTGWKTTGNANQTYGTNFLGTTDNKSILFKTNNTQAVKIDSTGKTTFATSIVTPLIIGGSAINSMISYKSTTGAGTSSIAAHYFTGGSNGGTELITVLNNGAIGFPTAVTNVGVGLSKQLTGNGATSAFSYYCTNEIQNDLTNTVRTFASNVSTKAAAFTLGTLAHYDALNATIGAASAITNQYGFKAAAFTGATNNYGFHGSVAAATNAWNLYMVGTANNALAGATRIGSTTAPTTTLDVTGNILASTTILSSGITSGIGYAVGSGSTVTQITSRTTGVTINAITGAITLVSAAGIVTYQTFVVTNSAVAAKDVIIVNQQSGTDLNIILVTNVAAGSFKISFATTGGVTTEQPVFNFAVIKGQTN